MAEKKNNKINKAKWDNVQKIGFWGLIVVSIAFWSGVYIGNYSANTTKNQLETAKVQAVEAYKAELKTSKQ